MAIDVALLDPEEEDAAVKEPEADAVSVLPELEVLDAVDDSVVSAEADVLVIVTSLSMLELPTVVLSASTDPTETSSTADSALPAYALVMLMSLALEELPASTVPVVLPNTLNRVSSVSELALAALLLLLLLLLVMSVSSEVSRFSSMFDPELELTALVDEEVTGNAVTYVTSCALMALTARAHAIVRRRSCICW